MKQAIFSFIILCFSPAIYAQEYANAWIHANQPYVKLSVAEDGIYRLDQSDLLQAGYDLSQINPDHLHLYFRGEEQLLFIQKNQQGKLRYLEFLGKRLDGGDDTYLYWESLQGKREAKRQTHPYLSLFSDTAAYFLTWNQSPSAFRYFNHFDPTYQAHTPEPHFRYTSRLAYDSPNFPARYILGSGEAINPFYDLNPNYVPGEGFIGPLFTLANPLDLVLDCPFPVNNPSILEFKARIFGQSSSRHLLKVLLNGDQANSVLDTIIRGEFLTTFTRSITYPQTLAPNPLLSFYALRDSNEKNHPVWVSLSYDRQFFLENERSIKISDWQKPSDAYFQFSQVDGWDTAYVYDEKNLIRNVGLIRNKEARVIVQGFQNKRDLLFSTDKGIQRPTIASTNLNRLSDFSNGAELLIITHRDLENSAKAFAMYRDTNQVNSLSSQVIFVDEIYDEFAYGSPTPLAIHRFCDFALNHWQVRPRYVLLWGKAEDQLRDTPGNLLPSYGNPASDQYYLTPLQASLQEDLIPQIPIGRVNIHSDAEGLTYLDKVMDYESQADIDWLQQAVFLGGGINANQQSIIQDFLIDKMTFFENSGYQRQGSICSNDTLFPSDPGCYTEINEGVGLIHFLGHSTSNIQDIDIGEADTYQNFGKYPLILAMGCNGGDFTVPSSFGERWINEPGRGAIAYIGATAFSFLSMMRKFGDFLYPQLYSPVHQRLGDALHASTVAFVSSGTGIQLSNHGLQFNLQGDPSLLWRGKETLTSIAPRYAPIALKVYPNPSRRSVTVSFELPSNGEVELQILNIQGQQVYRDQNYRIAGMNQIQWSPQKGLPEGIYLVKIEVDGFVASKKVIIRH